MRVLDMLEHLENGKISAQQIRRLAAATPEDLSHLPLWRREIIRIAREAIEEVERDKNK